MAGLNATRLASRAPGKLVVLGEYAVLEGAPAMVLAVDRYCRAAIGPSEDTRCHLLARTREDSAVSFTPEADSGFALVDAVVRNLPHAGAWRATLDSRELFTGGIKLGLGSSAAALTAWAGAWAAFTGQGPLVADAGTLRSLVDLHKASQGGAGSGIDVAASLFGGVIRYQLSALSEPGVSTARLPNSVGFAGVFTRSAASTPDFLARYNAWRAAAPEETAAEVAALARIAEGGIGAAAADDVDGFLAAVTDYGRCLEGLGERMGARVVTREHRGVNRIAERFRISYKVSGAGGGDLGLAFSADPGALEQFKKAVAEDYDVIEFSVDRTGLRVEVAPG